jgi:hypothetical protein
MSVPKASGKMKRPPPMKKIIFLAGAGVGFLLGSRAGNEPYQRLEAEVRKLAGRSDVQEVVGQAKSAVNEQVGNVTHLVAEKMPTSGNGAPSQTSTSPIGTEAGTAEPSGY